MASLITLDDFAAAFDFTQTKAAEWSFFGKVQSIDADGTLNVISGYTYDEDTDTVTPTVTACMPFCHAVVGDVVFVHVFNGNAVALNPKGGDESVSYELTKSGSTITLEGSDGSTSSVTENLTQMEGILPIASGGTGASTASDAFDNLFTVTPLSWTSDTTNVASISVNLCVRIGALCILSCDGSLRTSGVATWQNITLGTLNVTSTSWVYAVGRCNNGDTFVAQITTDSDEVVYRTLGKATTDSTFRFTLVFVCNEYTTPATIEEYEGAYEVTPLAEQQTILETQGMKMRGDVTVEEIPYYETSNLANGKTAIIAELED